MKIVFILSLLCLLHLNLARNEKKKRKLSTAKTAKKTGRKRTKMPRIFDVKIFINESKTPTSATIDAKPIKLASQGGLGLAAKQYGLHYKAATVGADLLALSFKNGDEYFIPYRYITGQGTISSSEVQAKSISATLATESAGKVTTSTIRIQFDFDPDWEIVTDAELGTLLDWASRAKARVSLDLSEEKEEVSNYANLYVNNKNSFEAASKGVDDVNTLISSYETKDQEVQNQNVGYKSQYNTLMTQLNTAEIDLATLKAAENAATTQVNNQNNLLKQLNDALLVLKTDDVSSADSIKVIEGELNGTKANFEAAIAVLVPEAAETANLLEQAKTSLYAGNLADCTTKIASSVA